MTDADVRHRRDSRRWWRRRIRDDDGVLVPLSVPWRKSDALKEAITNYSRAHGDRLAMLPILFGCGILAAAASRVFWLIILWLGPWIGVSLLIRVSYAFMAVEAAFVIAFSTGLIWLIREPKVVLRQAMLSLELCPACRYSLGPAIDTCTECGAVWRHRPDRPRRVSRRGRRQANLLAAKCFAILPMLMIVSEGSLMFAAAGTVTVLVALVTSIAWMLHARR